MIVLIAVMEKQVVITDSFNPNPVTGRQSIFSRVSAPTEAKVDVEIIGVYAKLDDANNARARHAQGHPGRRYLQKVCTLNDQPVGALEPPKCIKCRAEGRDTPIGPIGSFCAPCQQKHYQECVGLDPRGGQGDLVPVIQTTVGPQTVLLNQGA